MKASRIVIISILLVYGLVAISRYLMLSDETPDAPNGQPVSSAEQLQQELDFHRRERVPAIVDRSTFSFSASDKKTIATGDEIEFNNVCENIGINFQYRNGSPAKTPLSHLFETMGGGVAIVDYDVDGRPDLYLSQGGDWRQSGSVNRFSNTLFRNLSGTSSVDVTQQSLLESFEFSHGVTTGDYNGDGFADIYVCQLRGNQLYENQGDGTFVNVTEQAGVGGDDWSLSAAFADLNGDGLSDLYVVNYLDREQVMNAPCFTDDQIHACPPKLFSATVDRLYLNMGTGQFHEVSQLSGITNHAGKGMGIVIADYNRKGSLDLFVGNDGEENFLFQSIENKKSSLPRYEENAVRTGVATDAQGQLQATMGIASGDINGDGRLDLLVTNFYMESNTFYAQQETGLFEDLTASAGQLQQASQQVLGFGLQLLDVDLDGDFDAVFANGHVDRTSVTGEPDEMLPQLFINQGAGNLQPADPETVGQYFLQPALGRAVAKLDFNKDGKPDFCVTHLDQPFALLQNESKATAHSLRIKLVGTRGERDAIGTTVEVRCGTQTWMQQLTSGDGFLVSNEDLLLFGIGPHETIDEIKIYWQSGTTQRFVDIHADNEYLCIEDREELMQLPD